jgi:aspartyl-tRNA(Asn)/glutamyl-tRNA(Gln) amidotransferase subunit A
MKHDLTQMSAAELGKLYARGKASPVETVQAVLARAEAVNPVLNALCLIDAGPALAAARESERRWNRQKPLSPIDGVPVSIKELVRVKGWPASMGSKLTDKTPVDADAPAVARLREAGAIVFAQTTSSEFGHKGVTDTPLHGVTRNPWNPDVTPGGSSGGAGAAVAAGLGPLAIGTDGGGSLRIPSSFTGLVTLKATYGRVPNWPPTLNGDFSNTGPMCRTARDCALMLNAIARPDARDPTQLPANDTDYVKALSRKPRNSRKPKVAFLLRMSEHPLDLEVAAMVTRAAKRVEKLGCAVEEIAAPPFPHADAGKSFVTHWLTNSARLLDMFPQERHGEFDPALLAGAKAARERYTAKDVVEAHAVRREMAVAWNLFFETYDFLLTPTVAVQPFAVLQAAPAGLDGKPNFLWSPYTATFNLTRQPAASVPCGLSSQGLPVGLQIVSGHFRDAEVLALASAYADEHPLDFPVLPESK